MKNCNTGCDAPKQATFDKQNTDLYMNKQDPLRRVILDDHVSWYIQSVLSFLLPLFATRSQKRRSFHTRPTPLLSSHLCTRLPRSHTSPFHTPPTHFRRPSLSRSFSTARFLATSPGATKPSTHSPGKTPRCTRLSAEGRRGSLRDSRMATRLRANLRET